jgi:hypothetical protein
MLNNPINITTEMITATSDMNEKYKNSAPDLRKQELHAPGCLFSHPQTIMP